jgi:hypothetical protein
LGVDDFGILLIKLSARTVQRVTGQGHAFPGAVLVLVPDVGSLERIELRLHCQHHVDDVAEWKIEGVRPVPASPAEVIADGSDPC